MGKKYLIKDTRQPTENRTQYLPNTNQRFKVQGSVYRKYIVTYIQQDATLHSLFVSTNCSTCFGRYIYPVAHITLITASGTCQNITATFRWRGGIGTHETTAEGSRYGLTSARCCNYSYMCS